MPFDNTNTNTNLNVNVVNIGTNDADMGSAEELGEVVQSALTAANNSTPGTSSASGVEKIAQGYADMYVGGVKACVGAAEAYWSFWGGVFRGNR